MKSFESFESKTFRNVKIKDTLRRALNFSWKEGVLNNSQRQGIIPVLPKPNKNHLKVTSYSPITLVNVDYKITSKFIYTRMQKNLSPAYTPRPKWYKKKNEVLVSMFG